MCAGLTVGTIWPHDPTAMLSGLYGFLELLLKASVTAAGRVMDVGVSNFRKKRAEL